MNISPVSKTNSYCSKKNSAKSDKKIIDQINKGNSFDIFTKQIKQSKVKTGIVAGVLAALSAFGLYTSNKPQNVVTVPVEQNDNVEDLASKYNTDVNSVVLYNHLDEKQLSDVKEIKIPSSLDYIDNRINQLSKKTNTEKEIQALKQKQELQKQTATTYKDDNYIYFNLHLPNSEKSIAVEDFKKLFDIKDGALKDNNNNLSGEWQNFNNKDMAGSQYVDYTSSSLKNGETYKVKLSDINADNINIADY